MRFNADLFGLWDVGKKLIQGLIQFEFFLFNGLENQNGGKGFGDGADAVLGLGIGFGLATLVGKTEAASIDDLPVLAQGNAAHEALVLFQGIEIAIELGLIKSGLGLRLAEQAATSEQK
jgi:hypothetical protein